MFFVNSLKLPFKEKNNFLANTSFNSTVEFYEKSKFDFMNLKIFVIQFLNDNLSKVLEMLSTFDSIKLVFFNANSKFLLLSSKIVIF